MDLQIPLIPKSESLHGEWFTLQHGANAALIKCNSGTTETLIYVVFGDDFIAGLRVDRRTWILLPTTAVSSVTFNQLGASWLPPIRQTTEEARSYLQGLGPLDLRIWPAGTEQPLPASKGTVQGRWLVLSRAEDGQAERLVSFASIALIEVQDMRVVPGEAATHLPADATSPVATGAPGAAAWEPHEAPNGAPTGDLTTRPVSDLSQRLGGNY